MEAEGRLQHALSQRRSDGGKKDHGCECPSVKTPPHAASFRPSRPIRKARSRNCGYVLMEAMLALSILTTIGLILLKLSLNILAPRQWILQQAVTDAYMTYERAYAERIPFEKLLAADSPWPIFPATTTTIVETGRLPGNKAITGTVTRTRIADSGNYPIDGGTGTLATNPAAMKVWKAQSILTYKVGTRNYAKSRTVLRSQ